MFFHFHLFLDLREATHLCYDLSRLLRPVLYQRVKPRKNNWNWWALICVFEHNWCIHNSYTQGIPVDKMLIWDLSRDLHLLLIPCETLHKVRLSLHFELQKQILGLDSSCIQSLARSGLRFFHLLFNPDLKDSYIYGTEGHQSIFQKIVWCRL